MCIEKEAHEMLGGEMHNLIHRALPVMLPVDIAQSTLSICKIICERKAGVQIMSWVKEHLTESIIHIAL